MAITSINELTDLIYTDLFGETAKSLAPTKGEVYDAIRTHRRMFGLYKDLTDEVIVRLKRAVWRTVMGGSPWPFGEVP